jgi:hypothetical protein
MKQEIKNNGIESKIRKLSITRKIFSLLHPASLPVPFLGMSHVASSIEVSFVRVLNAFHPILPFRGTRRIEADGEMNDDEESDETPLETM